MSVQKNTPTFALFSTVAGAFAGPATGVARALEKIAATRPRSLKLLNCIFDASVLLRRGIEMLEVVDGDVKLGEL